MQSVFAIVLAAVAVQAIPQISPNALRCFECKTDSLKGVSVDGETLRFSNADKIDRAVCVLVCSSLTLFIRFDSYDSSVSSFPRPGGYDRCLYFSTLR